MDWVFCFLSSDVGVCVVIQSTDILCYLPRMLTLKQIVDLVLSLLRRSEVKTDVLAFFNNFLFFSLKSFSR